MSREAHSTTIIDNKQKKMCGRKELISEVLRNRKHRDFFFFFEVFFLLSGIFKRVISKIC